MQGRSEQGPAFMGADWGGMIRDARRMAAPIQPTKVPVFGTQGGGTVIWLDEFHRYVFVTSPPDFPDMKPGDFMPEEWTGGVMNMNPQEMANAVEAGLI